MVYLKCNEKAAELGVRAWYILWFKPNRFLKKSGAVWHTKMSWKSRKEPKKMCGIPLTPSGASVVVHSWLMW